MAKVEAVLQASRHGQETSGGMAQKKGKDGMTKVYQRKKQVCPLCDAVTTYFTTHLQRVHRFKKESRDYKEAVRKVRAYLGKRKEIKRLEKNFIGEKVVKKTGRKRFYKVVEPEVQKAGPSKPGKKPKSWALKTLVDEVSDGSDSDYGNIMPPTPPGVGAWKAYYETGKATTIRETLLVMFYRHLTECFGGCKKDSQAILHTQHVRRIHDFLDPNKDDTTFESLLKDGGIVVWRSWEMLMFVHGSGDRFPEYLKGGKISG